MSNELLSQTVEGLAEVQQLPPDLMLLKMENEQIFSVARMQPRDPMAIVAQLRALIEAYPAAADEAVYSKPVGTVQKIKCGNPTCGVFYEVNKITPETDCPACQSKERGEAKAVKKFAEGLSIRAAETIRSVYGYTRLATTTEQLDDDRVKVTGVLVDYAAGNVTSDERIVSPYYTSQYGQRTRMPEDRFLDVKVKAEKAKLRRDVILDNTPAIIKALFRDACEEQMQGLVAPEIIKQKIIPAFGHYEISPSQLDKIIGKPHELGWNDRERLECRKILNALKNGETTSHELLAGLETAPMEQTTVASGDLSQPTGNIEDNPHDKPAKAPKPSKEKTSQSKSGGQGNLLDTSPLA